MGQLLDRQFFSFGLALAQYLARRQHDVFQHRQMREGVPLLEHDADLLPQAVEVGGAVMDLDTVDADVAFLDRFQAVDAHQQGRFAGAGAADDRHHLALVHREVHALDHFEVAEGFVYVVDLNHFLATFFPDERRGGRPPGS
jgi:hypothetical protein